MLTTISGVALASDAPDPFYGCDFAVRGEAVTLTCLDGQATYEPSHAADAQGALREARAAISQSPSERAGYVSSSFQETTLSLGGVAYPALRVDTVLHKAGGESHNYVVALRRDGGYALASGSDRGLLAALAAHGLPAPAAARLRGSLSRVDIPAFGLENGGGYSGPVSVAGVAIDVPGDCWLNTSVNGGVHCDPHCGRDSACARPTLDWKLVREASEPLSFTAWVYDSWNGGYRDARNTRPVARASGSCRIAGCATTCWQLSFADAPEQVVETVGSIPMEKGVLEVHCIDPGGGALPGLCERLVALDDAGLRPVLP